MSISAGRTGLNNLSASLRMNNPYKRLFALARELGIDHETLREGAKSYTGTASVKSFMGRNGRLKPEYHEYCTVLQSEIDRRFFRKVAEIDKHIQENQRLHAAQRRFLGDLIAAVFGDIYKFRVWLQRTFNVATERFIGNDLAPRVIKALNEMRARGYKV